MSGEIYMNYLYGELNSQAIKVEYEGLETSTTVTTVDNDVNTIKVDVKKLTPQILSTQEPAGEGTYLLTISKSGGDMVFEYTKDLPEETIKSVINPSVIYDFLEEGDNVSIKQLEDKIKISAAIIPGFAYVSQSTVSSSEVPETTTLQKTNIYGENTDVSAGDSVVFPDVSGSLVLYIGSIKEVTEDAITVDNIKYIKNNNIMKGTWEKGPANYPECYAYAGYNWICMKNNVNEDPVEGANWHCLSSIKSTNIYFNLEGEKVDIGGINITYQLSTTSLYPNPTIHDSTIPLPKQGDVVIFATNKANYVGRITAVAGAEVSVLVKLAFAKVTNL